LDFASNLLGVLTSKVHPRSGNLPTQTDEPVCTDGMNLSVRMNKLFQVDAGPSVQNDESVHVNEMNSSSLIGSHFCRWQNSSTRTQARLQGQVHLFVRTYTHLRLLIYFFHPPSLLLLILYFTFGCGFAFLLCNAYSSCGRRRGHKHFKEDPFVISLKKVMRVVYMFLMLLYSALQALLWKALKSVSWDLKA
jgi:hypothetical protein